MSPSSNAARYACDGMLRVDFDGELQAHDHSGPLCGGRPIVFAPRGIVMLADDSDSSWLQVHFQLFRLVVVHVGQRLHSRLTVLSYT